MSNRGNGNIHDRAGEAEANGEHRNKDPCVHGVEKDLEEGIEGDESGGVLRVAVGQFVPHNHHRDAAGQANQNEPSHVFRVGVQEHNGQNEHQDGSDHPVLQEGQAQDAAVAENFVQLLVAHLGEGRIHHHNQSDRDGDGSRAVVAEGEHGQRLRI